MAVNCVSQNAGTLAVDDGDGLDAGQHAVVDVLIQSHQAFLGVHAAEIHFTAGVTLTAAGNALGNSAGFLLMLFRRFAIEGHAAFFLYQTKFLHRHLGLHNAGLHHNTVGAVHFGKNRALLLQLHDKNGIAFFQRTRQNVFLLQGADDRICRILQLVHGRTVAGFCALHQLGELLTLLLAANIVQLLQQFLRFGTNG